MKSLTSPRFWAMYRELPAEVRQSAREAYRHFLADPSMRGLRFHRLAGDPRIWSVRITRDFRAVGLVRQDTITWFWIGNHEDFDRTFPR